MVDEKTFQLIQCFVLRENVTSNEIKAISGDEKTNTKNTNIFKLMC